MSSVSRRARRRPKTPGCANRGKVPGPNAGGLPYDSPQRSFFPKKCRRAS